MLLFFLSTKTLFSKFSMNGLSFSSAKIRQRLPLEVYTVFQIGFGFHSGSVIWMKDVCLSALGLTYVLGTDGGLVAILKADRFSSEYFVKVLFFSRSSGMENLAWKDNCCMCKAAHE